MSVKIVFMVMAKMKMPPRTMTNSNCTPPLRSALVRQGRLCFRNPPHHRIRRIRLQDPRSLSSGGFLSFDACVCICVSYLRFCVSMYLCICVSMLSPTRSLHSFLCWIHVLCDISVFVVLLFLYLGCCFFCVFMYLIYFSVIADTVSF